MKKIVVDRDACMRCGACMSITQSEIFGSDSEGVSVVLKPNAVDDPNVTNAIEACPTGAISIEECNCDNGEPCSCEEGKCDCPNCEAHK